LVASLNKPGGNITGIAALTIELDAKRLELLHEIVPAKGSFGVLFNPTRPDSGLQIAGLKAAAQTFGRKLIFCDARKTEEIEAAFSSCLNGSITGVQVAADPFFTAQRRLVVAQMTLRGWPGVFQWREFAEIGGLASFGPNLSEMYRRAGLLAARILNGEKPGDLPVEQPTKFEFVVNLKTAKVLGLSVPLPLLARADEVIE
jgi:putative ABC transport system substrate-binding protein